MNGGNNLPKQPPKNSVTISDGHNPDVSPTKNRPNFIPNIQCGNHPAFLARLRLSNDGGTRHARDGKVINQRIADDVHMMRLAVDDAGQALNEPACATTIRKVQEHFSSGSAQKHVPHPASTAVT